ncbi:DUF3761 domain-containing protein [Mycobacterium kubicae]|uniref:DUF3761 domain-containing protein n=3 Tax=Mycobacterium kubicae TaxID=120959 RepID=A0AAX1J8I0_9MYCO|nr:DUF3761 domain-containing protein [Mycobacterium kubicae]QNI13241.1 DUF3761 domain-containing protein [Mycobacterium kubicae]QPI36760.1 DUF3761 domain-containing protein [Mycobacterium kubicae]
MVATVPPPAGEYSQTDPGSRSGRLAFPTGGPADQLDNTNEVLGDLMFRSWIIAVVAAGGLAVGAPAAAVAAPGPGSIATTSACPSGSYENSSGTCVPRPNNSDTDVSAVCQDGSHSHSQHRSGTCSGHGGVGQWCPCSFASGQPSTGRSPEADF